MMAGCTDEGGCNQKMFATVTVYGQTAQKIKQ
jgi:hypothetical protein